MSGVDLMAVKELLGHKRIDMTLRYAHLSPDHKRHAVDRLRFLDGHYLDTRVSNQILTNLVSCCDTSLAGVVKLADAPDSKSGEA
jgi:hypothetical protein